MNFVRTGEVARLLGVSVGTVRNYEREGILRSVKTLKGQRLFCREEVEKLVPKETVAT